MKNFPVMLKVLMKENDVDAKELASAIGLSDVSVIYKWFNGEKSLLLPTAVKMADYFNCSLDYLFGRSTEYVVNEYSSCPPFDLQFKKVLKEKNISQYRLIKDKIIARGNLDSWLRKKERPHIQSIIKLADYLNVSMDYLVGREV